MIVVGEWDDDATVPQTPRTAQTRAELPRPERLPEHYQLLEEIGSGGTRPSSRSASGSASYSFSGIQKSRG
jgi:hypothetical protein